MHRAPPDQNGELAISQRGADFTARAEGHTSILPNGNYEVEDTNDGKLTTYGGITIAERQNGNWVPINGFTQDQVDNRANGINPDAWKNNYDVFRQVSADAINRFASDNNISFSQHQFDALMDFTWNLGSSNFNRRREDGGYYYDFTNIMIEEGFFPNPTEDQRDRFEGAFGNLIRSEDKRLPGLWSRRMSQLGVFFGDHDENGDYIVRDFGNSSAVKTAADDWLTERGLRPTGPIN